MESHYLFAVDDVTTATRDVFYGYDILGRQLTARFDSVGGADGVTNAYDGFGNLASSTISMAGFSKAVSSLYDADNNRTRVTHPDAQAFTYAYDARDRLSGVYQGIGTGTPLDMFGWNSDGTLGSRTEGTGGGGSAAYGYDAVGRLTSQTDAFPAAPASNVGWTFGLSPASQITSETRDNDAYAFTGISSANKAYTINGLNQYTAVAGNLAADDPLLWYVGSGTGTKRYLHADHLGSVVAATNTSGGPTINAYDEYGVPKSGNVGRFQYTGQIWLSELGLYHYKARLYSPYLGRFLQVDPVGYKDPLNLYAYVGNDPVNGNDPTGLTCNSDGTECKIDDQGKMTPEQLQKATAAYQGAVDRLLADPDKKVTLRTAPTTGTRIPSSRTTTQGDMARALIAAKVSFVPQPRDKSGSEVKERAQGGGRVGDGYDILGRQLTAKFDLGMSIDARQLKLVKAKRSH
jgi:RHS repeat-associated protein